jgi:hypothetical protein
MSQLVKGSEDCLTRLDEVTIEYYGKTIWMVRRAMLQCYVLLESQKFAEYIVHQVAACGEKYELNLVLVSELAYRAIKGHTSPPSDLKAGVRRIVEILRERQSDELRRNVDVLSQLAQ